MYMMEPNYKPIIINDKKTNYAIDIYGNVINVKKGKVLAQTEDKDGYMTVHLSMGKKKKRCKVHRLVANAFIPNPENKPTVNHKSGNKKDNSIENLEHATYKEQLNHAINNNLYPSQKGMKNNGSKYSDDLIEKASKLILKNNIPDYEIDRQCGFARGYTYMLRHKKCRTDVTDKFFTNTGSTTIENYDDYYTIEIH